MAMMDNQKQPSSGRGASTSKGSAPAQSGGKQTDDEVSWIDPVCGMNVKRLSAFFTAEHEGTTYRFCSEACRADFEKDPARFAKASSAKAGD